MHDTLSSDLAQLPALLEAARQQCLDYLSSLPERSPSTTYAPEADLPLPGQGIGAQQALKEFVNTYEALMVASAGPRYWGYVTGGTTPAAIVGDWLATVYDQNAQSVKGQGDISARLEVATMDLILDLFGLSKEDFWGGFVTGATLSNFTCLGVARQWVGQQQGRDIARDGVRERMAVLSATPHSSAVKALSMLGLGSAHILPINTLPGHREAMDVNDLERQLSALEGQPAILITSGGTVNTVDFDDFKAIAALREKYAFWWHVDAAFGGFAACSPKHQHFLTGWEQADSLTVDCHKWMNVPYESAVFVIRKAHRLLQIATFQNSNAPYLGDPFERFNYLNLLPENSRRLKALPVWFSLMAYGREGYQSIVENCVELAQLLGAKIEAHPAFRLLAPVRLNNVCFTLTEATDEAVSDFLFRLNQTGTVFMTPSRFGGGAAIRCSLVNWRTSREDVERVLAEMSRLAKQGIDLQE
ncbi:MAG: pyridoxal-dependent decarboxylase [Bacteroidota bacterium]